VIYLDAPTVAEDFRYHVWPKVQHIDGWMDHDELLLLYTLARSLPDHGVIVEIGAWVGRTTATLAAASANQVWSVDPFDCSGNDPAYIRQVGFQPLLEWRRNVGDGPVPLIGTSEKAVQTWTSPIDMLLIDGDHSYEAVKHDLKAWTPFLKVGGYLVLDDYYPAGRGDRWEGVGQAAREFLGGPYWSLPSTLNKLLITRKAQDAA
jgi:predicted O-methyltransferase YrrM